MVDPIREVDLSSLHVHSQGSEQAIIGRFFQEEASDYTAFFVDVGAYDGITGSNSRFLAELGWSGMLIEPTPEAFARLQAVYRENPRINCCRCAVSDYAARSVEMLVSEGPPETPAEAAWQYGQVSTLNAWFARNYIEQHGYRYKRVNVEVRPLLAILREGACPPNFGLLCIDCEGEDLRILSALDFVEFQPRLVSVECDDRNRSMFSDLLLPRGYVEYDHTPCNTLFRRRA